MTPKDFAKIIDSRDYIQMIVHDHRNDDNLAAASNLVFVYGASDDLVEFRGAINDEADAHGGTEIYLTSNGILSIPECGESGCKECKYFKEAQKAARSIKVIWGAGGVSWSFETEIPHETFTITEDGYPYCTGIVFSVDDL